MRYLVKKSFSIGFLPICVLLLQQKQMIFEMKPPNLGYLHYLLLPLRLLC